jgi:hypothetical protein
MRLKHNLPSDVARCTQEDCLLKNDCLRSLAFRFEDSYKRITITEFPPVTKMEQGCNHQIPMPSIGENQPIS